MVRPWPLTRGAVDLILGDDDLTGIGIVGVLDGMTQDTDHPDHLASFPHAISDVAGVTDELLAACNLPRNQ